MLTMKALAVLATAAAALGNPIVDTKYGKVEGKVDKETTTEFFWGIPFAKPPLGDLRFAPPVEPDNYTHTIRTTALRPAECSQMHVEKGIIFGKEDCLTLDVYRPQNATNLPVMIWIYGGGFVTGSDSPQEYNGKYLAKNKSMIVVTLNYRVNNIGFLALEALMQEHGTTGNYGLLDQQMGMKWVHENIAYFGGDNTKVMIFGQSAGGCSIVGQLAMPSSKPYFQAAVAESPLAVSDISWMSYKNATHFGEIYASSVNCSRGVNQLKCLRALPIKTLMNKLLEWRHDLPADDQQGLPRLMPIMSWWPTIDGTTLPKRPVDAARDGTLNDVPTIIGTVHDEGTVFVPMVPLVINGGKTPVVYPLTWEGLHRTLLHFFNATTVAQLEDFYGRTLSPTDTANNLLRDFIFTCPARHILRSMNSNPARKNKVWTYQFAAHLNYPGFNELGDFHASEIPYVFEEPGEYWNETDYRLSNLLSSYWSSMASKGYPECDGCTTWTPYTADLTSVDDSYMKLATPNTMEPNLLKVYCDFWDRIGYYNNP
eukprot:TRINITY_DN9109_c0_g3_i3.p1 TRINITY_DN9109_c0_g3~~TRINITY_DN9109_c0_g3_i3.p1  ORF type:complete len:540 (+),score=106.83 TRINITY_DN9109_c0_g3_i3:58-1677(+)